MRACLKTQIWQKWQKYQKWQKWQVCQVWMTGSLSVWAATVMACASPMSDEEFARRFEALAARKAPAEVAPKPEADGGAKPVADVVETAPDVVAEVKPEEADKVEEVTYETTCLPDEAKKKARETAKLLLALEALLADFAPQLPVAPDLPEKCLTKIAEKNDPAGADIEARLSADYAKAADEARRAQAEILRRFEKVDLPLAWSWVTAIVPGREFEVAPGALVTAPTELMNRLAKHPKLKVDALQHCIVAQAEMVDGQLLLTCRGPRQREFFHVEVEPAAGEAGGKLATVSVGDLVAFSDHLILVHRKRGSRDELRWEFRRVPADGVSIAAPSTCCNAGGK
jgi:hypothetical protein